MGGEPSRCGASGADSSGEGGEFCGWGAFRLQMETEIDPPHLGTLARRQWGVVTRAQLIALRPAEHGIAEWVRAGRLRRLYRGVYAVGHDRLRREGRWLAAVMACGPGAALSHRDCRRSCGIFVRATRRHRCHRAVEKRANRRRRDRASTDRAASARGGHGAARHSGDHRRANPARSRRRARQTGTEKSDHGGGVHKPIRPDCHQCCRSKQPGPHAAQSSWQRSARQATARARSWRIDSSPSSSATASSRRRPGVSIEGYEARLRMDASRPGRRARRTCRAHHALHLQCRSIA